MKKQKLDKFTPVPDSLLAGAAVRRQGVRGCGLKHCGGWVSRRSGCACGKEMPPTCTLQRHVASLWSAALARPNNNPSSSSHSQARDATASAIDARGAGGLETPMGGATTDLTAIGAGRNTVVQVRAVLCSGQRNTPAFRLFLCRVARSGLLLWSCPLLQPPNNSLT